MAYHDCFTGQLWMPTLDEDIETLRRTFMKGPIFQTLFYSNSLNFLPRPVQKGFSSILLRCKFFCGRYRRPKLPLKGCLILCSGKLSDADLALQN